MSEQELVERIEALEKQVAKLEKRSIPILPYNPVPYPMPFYPWPVPCYPWPPQITWEVTTTAKEGDPVTVADTAGLMK